jgi:hypothetical protein
VRAVDLQRRMAFAGVSAAAHRLDRAMHRRPAASKSAYVPADAKYRYRAFAGEKNSNQ